MSLASNALKECVIAIQAVRDEIDIIASNYPLNLNSRSSTASNESDSIAAKEACDLICNQLRDRFESTDYVQSFKLVKPFVLRSKQIEFPGETSRYCMQKLLYVDKRQVTH